MLKSSSRILDELRPRLDALAQQNPEWRSWLILLEETLRVMEEPVWTDIRPQPGRDRSPAAPLLDGVVLTIDGRRTRNWVHNLIQTAAKHARLGATPLATADFSRLDALALLKATMQQDHTQIATQAVEAGVEPQALVAVAQLAAMPLLQACGRHFASQVSLGWSHGYCPVCGAWPTLAEVRGLERSRKLRCSRCGGEWGHTWLHCPYCGEANHRQLGFLHLEGREETNQVETCATCKGYLKAQTTLQGSPPYAVILADLATVDLDIVALERGYRRPERPGYVIADCRMRIWD